MGTEFFSTIPFTAMPDTIGWKVENESSFFIYFDFNCRDEYRFSLLSKKLIQLHSDYHLENAVLAVIWEHEERGVIVYSLATQSTTLLVFMNLSNKSITFVFKLFFTL